MNKYNRNKLNGWPLVSAILLSVLLVEVANAADVFNGRSVYETHCSSCHGEDGTSMMPGTPDFTSGELTVRPDTTLLAQIREGTDFMPAYRGILSDSEILDVIAYIRSLQR